MAEHLVAALSRETRVFATPPSYVPPGRLQDWTRHTGTRRDFALLRQTSTVAVTRKISHREAAAAPQQPGTNRVD